MSAINTLIVEAKNKLDEIQDAVDRRPTLIKPDVGDANTAISVYNDLNAAAVRDGSEPGSVGVYVSTLRLQRNTLKAELKEARNDIAALTAKLAGYKKVVDRLQASRQETRKVLRAKKTERTATAARRTRAAGVSR